MAPRFGFLNGIAALTPANLTIEQAARLAENPLDLRYRAIFPRKDAPSIKMSSISTVDFRPVGGRREWNAQPRIVPEKIGPQREFSIVPIEFSHPIDELALQLLGESGMQELIRQGVIKSVETWPPALADACERQLERDAFQAWYTGAIVVKDTKSSAAVTVSLGFDQATTYPTAGTIWSDAGQNAYDNFLAAVQAAYSKFGGNVGAARSHRTVFAAMIADAPDGPNGLRPTFTSLQERVREEGFPNLSLVIDERTYDEFDDGGSATTSRYYVPEGLIGFQPADGRVGTTHVAPVVRAYDFLSGGNRKLVNGTVILLSEENDGKTLKIAAQTNAITMPEERRTYVVDTSIPR